ncbi:MAG: extracellular solute-binding protein [Thermoanaerobacteraceae bacterium]|jgi:multiple sugar transport system substrate-binding protein|nr:extracellular solute-binding protein [Thermoanaerobacteraceae bacterium]
MKTSKLFLKVAVMVFVIMSLCPIGGASKELTLWTGYPEMEPFFKAAAQWYQELHPDVVINVASFPLREVERKYAVSLPTGTGPDIAEAHLYIAQMHIENGSILPNDEEIDSYLKSGVYNPLMVSESTWQDKTYGLPILFSLDSMLWNVDMFHEAGFHAGPKDWDEMVEMAKKLTKYDAEGRVIRSGLDLRLFGAGSGVAAKWWYFLKSAGGDLFEEVEPGKYRAAYDNEAGFETTKLYIDGVHKHRFTSFEIKHDTEAFANELSAMFVREAWVVGYMRKNAPNVNFDVSPMPAYKKTNALYFWTNLYVTNSSKHPDIAKDFLMFVANGPKLKELEDIMYEEVGWLPPRNDALTRHPDVYERIPQYKGFTTVPENYELYPYPRVSVTDEAFTKLAERLVKIYQNESFVDDHDGLRKAIHEAAEETNEVLKDAGLYAQE